MNTGGRRRPTIEDVAAEAGVSRGTVSRVLNGGLNVSADALAAVDAAIRKTGYVVNLHARAMVTQRSGTVAFVLSEPQERFFTDPNFNVLLRACTQALADHDIALLLAFAGTPDEQKRVLRFLGGGHVDGALLVSTHTGDPFVGQVLGLGLPIVACGQPIGHEGALPYVGVDELDGARQVVAHLVAVGRRAVATITGPLDTPGGVKRLAGWRETTGGDDTLVAYGDYSRESGEAAMGELLERRPDLDAVFVASDLMAVGALDALRRAGRRVPEDVAVAGFDDSPVAATAVPPLTTMRQPFKRISAEMVRLLLARIEGEPLASVVLPTVLVERASTG
ncbi:DNA-binding LacI/PurR family transcriptional regulator [Catenulispora sp. EB89]|uniref:LacI family DNA-binding transcriptional regulator n=1 Tax=Catenulispora sp. EB89 TaxID=3156257 RepID=UPI003512F9EB